MRKTLLFLAAITAALPIWSANIYFDTLPSTQMYGTYNGPVGGSIDNARFDNLVCDDYYHTTYVASGPWEFDISTLPTLTYARFGVGAIDQYRQAAILLAGDGNTLEGLLHTTGSAAIADYQYALWNLFSPSAPLPGNSASILATVQGENLGDAAFSQIYSGLRVWTPRAGAASNQEFLQVAAVPEPGTITMLASGAALILVGSFRARRRR
jgi:hypothetical protein